MGGFISAKGPRGWVQQVWVLLLQVRLGAGDLQWRPGVNTVALALPPAVPPLQIGRAHV